MHIPPFYGPWRNIEAEDVWHNDDECPIGQRIPLAARLPGTDHIRPWCSRCAALGQHTNLESASPTPA